MVDSAPGYSPEEEGIGEGARQLVHVERERAAIEGESPMFALEFGVQSGWSSLTHAHSHVMAVLGLAEPGTRFGQCHRVGRE